MVGNEKCSFCGGTHYILSTQREGKNWICEKICKNCDNVISQNSISG